MCSLPYTVESPKIHSKPYTRNESENPEMSGKFA
jgi:hypothetical protein